MVWLRHVIYTAYRQLSSSVMAKYNVVFVLGGPGAGKGTQCENIVKVANKNTCISYFNII